MTMQQFKWMLDECLKEELSNIRKEALKLAISGGVDLKKEETYAIVKTIISVALKNESRQYSPLTEEYKKIARNLEKF